MISVPGPMMMSTFGWMSGLPALPMAEMRPSVMATSALTIPQWSRMTALVMTVSAAPSAPGRLPLPHAVADHLAAAELHLLAIGGEILLDLDEKLGVGEPHPVAGGGAEHVGVGGAGERGAGVAGHEWTSQGMGENKFDFSASRSKVAVEAQPRLALTSASR